MQYQWLPVPGTCTGDQGWDGIRVVDFGLAGAVALSRREPCLRASPITSLHCFALPQVRCTNRTPCMRAKAVPPVTRAPPLVPQLKPEYTNVQDRAGNDLQPSVSAAATRAQARARATAPRGARGAAPWPAGCSWCCLPLREQRNHDISSCPHLPARPLLHIHPLYHASHVHQGWCYNVGFSKRDLWGCPTSSGASPSASSHGTAWGSPATPSLQAPGNFS